ncbi:MAG TPA: glycosyltransferase family 39 protein [Chloroflexia bacterium]|jgi:4-amino-4-deoxy-L-arabinose transferase-like glycosyltransferase
MPATRPHRAWLLLAGISLLALVIRLWSLDYYGLWYDEVASIEIASRGPLAIFTDRFGGMLVQTPLHYFLVWLTSMPINPASSPILVRLPSALAGALTPLAVYLLGRELFGRAQGLIAALLLALSAIHVSHSQDVRPYTFLVLSTALSVYCLLVARRTASARWWAAFALSTIAALHFSYFTLTLFMPALAPILLWVLYRLWSQRRKERKSLRYALISLAILGIAAIPLAFDIFHVHRTAPAWERLPNILPAQLSLFFTRLAQLGIGSPTEPYIQLGFFLLAALGAIVALYQRRTHAVLLCILLTLIPGIELAAFRTTNIVFQRYALFAMPFYFLLIANGLVSLWPSPRARQQLAHIWRAAAGAVSAAVLTLFIFSLYIYFNPQEHRRLSSLPDYRGAALYLSQQAGPGDLIILADEPALGMAVVNFYWHGTPPAPTYDSRDPRVFAQRPTGSIYWVVSFFQQDPGFVASLPSADPAWSDPANFERIVIMRERNPESVLTGMERLVTWLETRSLGFQPVATLRGGIFQAQGDPTQAAESYRRAGAYYPQLAEEFLATATGFDARHNPNMAWREALTSKFMRPGNPQVHLLLAQHLRDNGYPDQAQIETEIAQALQK